MSIALLVFPDFLLIGIGVLLRRKLGFSADFFAGLERLVYYVLFPALLFQSVLRTPIHWADATGLIAAIVALIACGIVMSWAALWVLKPQPVPFASTVQCGFRFNSYLGLALASSLGGSAGATTMALMIGFAVPLANLAAVYALARHGSAGLFSALVRNPLLVSTLLGLIGNLAGLTLPVPIDTLLSRLGTASLALGIICVGASLTLQGARAAQGLVTWMVAVKLLAMPTAALAIGVLLGLSPVERHMLFLFACLPTASSAYVLAARMGGDGRLASLTISIGTVASILTIPLWMQLVR